MDTIDFLAPCNCGALGDHPRTTECIHSPVVSMEVSGPRSTCLATIGSLRTAGYHVEIDHEWQDPATKRWVFKIMAVEPAARPDPNSTTKWLF